MTLNRNYDMNALLIESDERGFIIGESRLGEGILLDSAGTWVDIKGDFTSMSIDRSVTIDGGVFFRPEASSLSLTTKDTSYAENAYNKAIRVRYAPPATTYNAMDYAYWNFGAGSATYTLSNDTTVYDTAPSSRKMVLSAAAGRMYLGHNSDYWRVTPGETVTVSIKYNIPVALTGGAATMYFQFVDYWGNTLGTSPATTLTATSGWQAFTSTGVAPANTYKIRLYVYDQTGHTGTHTLWYDTIQVTSVATPITLFNGTVRNVAVVAGPGDAHEAVQYRLSVDARDAVETLNNMVWYDFTAAQETAALRAVRGWPDATATGMTRVMPARAGDSPTALEVLQDAADASLARFYVDANNNVILDATTPTDPEMVFSDVHPTPVYNMMFEDAYADFWGAGGTTTTSSTTYFIEGTSSQKVTFGGTDTDVIGENYEYYTVTAGKKYTASISAYVAAAFPHGIRLIVDWLDTPGAVISTYVSNTSDAPTTGAWSTAYGTFTAPAGAVEAQVYVQVVGTPAAGKVIYFDQFAFHEGEYLPFEALFTDGETLPVHACYKNVNFENSLENTVTSVIAVAKSDETKTATRTLGGAVLTNQKTYTVDILTDSISMDAWVESFPLRQQTSLEPRSMDVDFDYNILGLDLCDLISVTLQGKTYEAGVKSIRHTITPDKWNVGYDLVPGHVVRHSNVVVPGNPVSVRTTARADNSITIAWDAPAATGSMTGYEVRYKVGTTAPSSRTDGTLLATLPVTTQTYNHTGLTSMKDYSYAVFTITEVPAVYGMATHASWTNAKAPSNPPSVTTSKPATTSIKVDWTTPTTQGDLAYYHVYWLQGSTVVSSATVNAPTQTYTITGLPRNQSYTIKVVAVSKTFHGSAWANSGTTTTANTNEALPSVTRSLLWTNSYRSGSTTSTNYLKWTAPASPGADFNGYHVRYAVGTTAPSLSTGTALTDLPASATSTAALVLPHGTTYTFSIWAKTIGGLYGPVATKTVTA